jgi:methanogenic corrinoid protein MtbC1
MIDLKELYEHQDKLAQEILNHMYCNEPFNNKEREAKAIKDIKWTILFIIEGLRVNKTTIVNDLFAWFKRLFKGLNIPEEHVMLLYKSTKQILHNTYKDNDVDRFMDQINIHKQEDMTYLNYKNPYKEEKDVYMNALLTSNRDTAQSLIMSMLDQGVGIHEIYLYIFQQSMYEIGLLWQDGIINVGREHYATAVTQYMMSTLYPYIFRDNKLKNRHMIACAVGSELHEMGIRMVADLFEMHGWNTDYLGANLPTEQLIAFVKEKKPQLIALSITMPYHIGVLKETIQAIREDEALNDVKIMVGGRPFYNNKELPLELGADAYASNAMEGIEIANQLLE